MERYGEMELKTSTIEEKKKRKRNSICGINIHTEVEKKTPMQKIIEQYGIQINKDELIKKEIK